MADKKSKKADQIVAAQDVVNAIQTIKEFQAANPDVDIASLLPKSELGDLQSVLGMLKNRELDRFVIHAKEMGTKMSFADMEMGVLAAGRRDMQNGLAEIADSLKFERPVSTEDGEEMKDRGRSKKK